MEDMILKGHSPEGKKGRAVKVRAMDSLYEVIDETLGTLERRSPFKEPLWKLLKQGRKIVFIPLVHGISHIESAGTADQGDWMLAAAAMRWFHDHMGVSYYHMSLGLAANDLNALREQYKAKGLTLPPEALIEGLWEDRFIGWGFRFARRYLSDASDSELGDDPLRGLQESMAGAYLPPWAAFDRLMVYNLNESVPDPARYRAVKTDEGPVRSFHKLLVGGDPDDANDLLLYPGSIVVTLHRQSTGDGPEPCRDDDFCKRLVPGAEGFRLHLVDGLRRRNLPGGFASAFLRQ